jgi:signal transduction histidine kinase
MNKPTIPANEQLRLEDLRSYDILDTDAEQDYDDLVQLASHICNCPIAAITFVDENRQWAKAKKALSKKETHRDIAFCAHTINQQEVFMVTDARTDKRFRDNPLVTGKMQVGFYAGAPIVSSAGFTLGSVCVIDNKKKPALSKAEKEALTVIARQVSRLLELGLKNKQLKEYAEARLKAEKRIAQLTIEQSDKQESRIAYELHENLAQSLAATKLFLDSAEISDELLPQYLELGRKNLADSISEVRKLSRSIVPTTFQNADYYWYISEFCQQFSRQYGVSIQLDEIKNEVELRANMGLQIFKIVQHQLTLAKNCGATKIKIGITTGKKLAVNMTDNRILKQLDADSIDLFNSINTRVEMIAGTVTRKFTAKTNWLCLSVPL